MKLEIVSHCVNYAKLLSFQLSSLLLHPPGAAHAVKYTLCYTSEDELTEQTRRLFAGLSAPGLSWNWQEMPPFLLNRRAIGRNQAALCSDADWIWFADVDYCFGPGCFDTLAQAAATGGSLIYPRQVFATSREGGDRLLEETPSLPAVRAVPADCWSTSQEYRVAIGGVQIARGDECRERGYLRDSRRWQRGAKTWQGCREDPAFRRSLRTRGQSVEIAGVYRIRHNAKGRYDPSVRL